MSIEKYYALVPKDRHSQPARSWNDVIGYGQATDFGGSGDLEEIRKVCTLYFARNGGFEHLPLVGERVASIKEATHMIIRMSTFSKPDFLLWQVGDRDAPVDDKDTIFLAAKIVDLKVTMKLKDLAPTADNAPAT